MTSIILIILGGIIALLLFDKVTVVKQDNNHFTKPVTSQYENILIKYQILLRYLLSDSSSRITNQTKTRVEIEFDIQIAKVNYSINQLVDEVFIEVQVLSSEHGRIQKDFKFPDSMDQHKMFQVMTSHIMERLGNSFSPVTPDYENMVKKLTDGGSLNRESAYDWIAMYYENLGDKKNQDQVEN